jgi:hypothetical protein
MAYQRLKKNGGEKNIGEINSEYHNFGGLILRDRKYLDLLDIWKSSVESTERLKKTAQILIRKGFTNYDFYCSYQLLYRSKSEVQIHDLIPASSNITVG